MDLIQPHRLSKDCFGRYHKLKLIISTCVNRVLIYLKTGFIENFFLMFLGFLDKKHHFQTFFQTLQGADGSQFSLISYYLS